MRGIRSQDAREPKRLPAPVVRNRDKAVRDAYRRNQQRDEVRDREPQGAVEEDDACLLARDVNVRQRRVVRVGELSGEQALSGLQLLEAALFGLCCY